MRSQLTSKRKPIGRHFCAFFFHCLVYLPVICQPFNVLVWCKMHYLISMNKIEFTLVPTASTGSYEVAVHFIDRPATKKKCKNLMDCTASKKQLFLRTICGTFLLSHNFCQNFCDSFGTIIQFFSKIWIRAQKMKTAALLFTNN